MIVHTTKGDLEESVLLKTERTLDNDNEHTTSVEYCLASCVGDAHETNRPDSPSFFCKYHVHRSAHVTLKKNVSSSSAVGGFR